MKYSVIDETNNPFGEKDRGKFLGAFNTTEEAFKFLKQYEKDNPDTYCVVQYNRKVCRNCAIWVEENFNGLEVPVGRCPLLSDYVATETDNGNVAWNNSFKPQANFGCVLWSSK